MMTVPVLKATLPKIDKVVLTLTAMDILIVMILGLIPMAQMYFQMMIHSGGIAIPMVMAMSHQETTQIVV